MSIPQQIQNYVLSIDEPKRNEIEVLHQMILKINPKIQLWFENGLNEEGKVISNPNIGYGTYTINYANGKTKDFFRIGLSANTKGISVYIMGIEDKKYLLDNFGSTIGKAKVTGYCINFKTIHDIQLEVLAEVLKFGLEQE
ncbi:DUF1801 domain-containing protein [Flavobacterium urocaniciphilum]|uniref:Uncharacterized protein n=1 Tax=Flavobacterium urocaniciphilum TaxID=1299341 RepID=A0A1H8Z302_9FLAO|nr:DUF1801 domain-containing protein [Flavobacterium urocaniciphilum]SEP58647.1 protein of unknown function (DU1801) [Flavobacterium urocaniciphilum]